MTILESNEMNKINFVKARNSVELHLADGRIISGPRGTSLESFLKIMPEWSTEAIMGAIVNSELRELTFPVKMDCNVTPISMKDADGARIYRRSVTFLVEAAYEELFPGSYLTVDHSIATGGYFCEVKGREPLSLEEIKQLENHMRYLTEADLPFERSQIPLEEAVEIFQQKEQADKVELLKYRQKNHLVVYKLGNHQDYHHGYMVPSTGYLKWFDLQKFGNGFALRFPRRHTPTILEPMTGTEGLLATYQQYGDWLDRLGINHVGQLNKSISEKKIREVVLISEALHEQKISDIATKIITDPRKPRIVLIAGPSSSGKTTFSKRLSIQLLAQGVEPFAIELDNYFVDREKTPKDENGDYDFESIGAVKVDLLSHHLQGLINGEEIQLPKYDFKEGKAVTGDTIRLHKDQVLILEGIHGLNPALLPGIPTKSLFRLYASCLTQLNLDRYNRISTTDTRLIRRIIRDARERGYTARDTIQRWESVRRGEKRYIFPFQEHADEMFNSALVFEISALKTMVEPLLRQVPFGTHEYIEAKRLLAFIEWFLPMDTDIIPDNSILREFIGNSILKNYKAWRH